MTEIDHQAAARAFQRVLDRQPSHLGALAGLGAELRLLGRDAEAEACCRRALAIRPDEPSALRTLGGMLQLQGRYDEAIALADAAIAARPGCGEAWVTRGDSLANSGRQADAVEAYRMALGDDEVAFDALVRMGKMHRVLGRADAAIEAFDAALKLQPASAGPQYERALLKLQLRDFAAGWQDYEARWRSEWSASARGFIPQAMIPLLTSGASAADLTGKRVLLIGEQGVGDQLMFASMIPDLVRVAASVVCVCEPRLIRLFSASFADVSFLHPSAARIDSESVDLLLAMGSLGLAFRPKAQDFPGTAYLHPGEDARTRWAARLGALRKRLRVGLSWRGGTPETGRLARSLPLDALRPILDLADCEFVSLQYGDVAAEVAAMNAGRPEAIRLFPPDELNDFEEQAGLIANLDAVVSVQNAAVHLTGAVGKPCLTLAPHNAEWRYMRDGQTMPWYRSVRLFRQPAPGDWSPVVGEVSAALQGLV